MNKQRKDNFLKNPASKENRYQTEKPKNLVRTRHDYPPLTFGARRIHYQFSAVLPTIHLTLVSILQGLAFGVLLLGLPISNPHQIYWVDFLLDEYFYLPYLTSSLLILLIWKEFAQACFYSNWPLSSLQSGLIYLSAVPEILAFRAISITAGDDPKLTPTMLIGWLIGIGFVGIIGGLIRLNNNQLEKMTDYESEEIAKDSFKLERFEGLEYIILGAFMVLFGIVYEFLIAFKVLNNVPQISSIMSWTIIALILIIVSAVFLQDMKGRKELLIKALENSDLIVSDKEVLRYSPDIEEEPSEIQTLIREVKELRALVQTLVEERETSLNATLISNQKFSDKVNDQNVNHSWTIVDRVIKAVGIRIKQR